MRILALLLAVAAADFALAQAGSTGGTLGKQDQSLSGDQAKQPSPRQPARKNIQKSGARTFNNPKINGIPVDNCLSYAADCGEPSATAWCRSKGLRRAVTWDMAHMPQTYVQSGGIICGVLGPCGGFTRIVCE
jgi:hypothetical protein